MDHMKPLDAEFLYLENGTTHMHIASCAVFEGPAPAYEELVALFASKLPLVPRYRQRVRFVPMDLGREYLPFVPLGSGVRIGVAILSYNGQLHFGITGDYDAAPDIGVLGDGIDAAVATLLGLARRRYRRGGHRPDRRVLVDHGRDRLPVRVATPYCTGAGLSASADCVRRFGGESVSGMVRSLVPLVRGG
jgi:hypothetical protein